MDRRNKSNINRDFDDKRLFLITLDEDIFNVYFENLSLSDCLKQ